MLVNNARNIIYDIKRKLKNAAFFYGYTLTEQIKNSEKRFEDVINNLLG